MSDALLITGGAGFIGANAVHFFARRGWEVTALDNFSRDGTERNADWLRQETGVEIERLDIRDASALEAAVGRRPYQAVLHLASQVAVTLSVADPREDFEINALGTFNLLEAVRRHCPDAAVINASTNKVYGRLEGVRVVERERRYEYEDLPDGVGEDQPLQFHSPYGCSKGAADQYALDYARIYALSATTFRQSCIYGTRQFGMADQGWVTWFAIAAVYGRPITIFGDGRQTRDLLWVDDLLAAYEQAFRAPDVVRGQAFNVGGGADNSLSLLELLAILEEELGRPVPVRHDSWRPGDQPVFIADSSKLRRTLGWRPQVGVREGIRRLVGWVQANPSLFGA